MHYDLRLMNLEQYVTTIGQINPSHIRVSILCLLFSLSLYALRILILLRPV